MNKQEYAEYLAHPSWASKREELFRTLGKRCSRFGCGASTNLHIHHKTYTLGKLPWEYPAENFEVLCEKHHSEAHAIPYVQRKCRGCGKVISQGFEFCIPCQNDAHKKQERELERVVRERDRFKAESIRDSERIRLETERMRTEGVTMESGQSQPSRKSSGFPWLVAVILTCFVALGFWPQEKTTSFVSPNYRTAPPPALSTPRKQTERAAPPVTPTSSREPVQQAERDNRPTDAKEKFHASSKSNIYHNPSCEWARKIYRQQLRVFSTEDEARRRGYRPCKVCRP